jgi:hypothetical protein
MPLRLMAGTIWLLVSLFGPAFAGGVDERLKSVFISLGEKGDHDSSSIRYRQWVNLLDHQIQMHIRDALSQLQSAEEGKYLKGFDVDFQYETKLLSQNEVESRWQQLGLLQIVQGVPIASADQEFHMTATVYLGSLKGALKDDSFDLDEEMRGKAARATADALVLITLYALTENAVAIHKKDTLVCALIGEAHNFLNDVATADANTTVVTGNATNVAALIAPVLEKRRLERACPDV